MRSRRKLSGLYYMEAAAVHQIEVIESFKNLTDINLTYLIAGMATPCPVFVYSHEKFYEFLKTKEIVTLKQLHELKSQFNNFGFIRISDKPLWDTWKASRHPQLEPLEVIGLDPDALIAKIKNPKLRSIIYDYLGYADSKINYDVKTEAEEAKLKQAKNLFKTMTYNKMVEWFFLNRPNDELFYHSSRVTYLTILFAILGLPTMPRDKLETLALSSLIHELDGSPSETAIQSVSVRTLEMISEAKHTISLSVLNVIKHHDELFNGKGSPQGLKGKAINALSRIFAFPNRWDHFRLIHSGGTRRVKFERNKDLFNEHKDEFDPIVWKFFLPFIEKVEILD